MDHEDTSGDIIDLVQPEEKVSYTEVETRILKIAIVEAQTANKLFQEAHQILQQAQANVQQKREDLNAKGQIVQSTYRTVMVLKNLNPDAFVLSWDDNLPDMPLTLKPVEANKGAVE